MEYKIKKKEVRIKLWTTSIKIYDDSWSIKRNYPTYNDPIMEINFDIDLNNDFVEKLVNYKTNEKISLLTNKSVSFYEERSLFSGEILYISNLRRTQCNCSFTAHLRNLIEERIQLPESYKYDIYGKIINKIGL